MSPSALPRNDRGRATRSFAPAATLLMALAGCAIDGTSGLTPGRSTAADVEARMGPPTEKVQLPDHANTWFYSRQPMGRQTIAMRIGADGVLQSVEPVLNYGNLAKVTRGKTTREEVRQILGPPYRIERMPLQRQDAWEYWMVLDAVPSHVWLMFSDDGIVRDVIKSEDLPRDPGRRG
jgi:hypothetical protein